MIIAYRPPFFNKSRPAEKPIKAGNRKTVKNLRPTPSQCTPNGLGFVFHIAEGVARDVSLFSFFTSL